MQSFGDENYPDEEAAAEERKLREQREKRKEDLQVSLGCITPPAI